VKYLYPFIGAVLLITGIFYAGHRHGLESCRAAQAQAVEQEREQEAKDLQELEQKSQLREVKTREIIRYIQRKPDPTGCLDTPIDPDVYERVPKADGQAP